MAVWTWVGMAEEGTGLRWEYTEEGALCARVCMCA